MSTVATEFDPPTLRAIGFWAANRRLHFELALRESDNDFQLKVTEHVPGRHAAVVCNTSIADTDIIQLASLIEEYWIVG